MTYPGQGWPDQPPPDNQGQPPGGWPQPQYPYGQEQFPQQPYQGGLLNPGQQPYPGQQQPFPGQQPYPGRQPYPTMQYPINQGPYGQVPVQPGSRKRRSGLAIGVVAAVVVLAGGGVGTYFAFNHAAKIGSASPQAAATKLVADVSHDDVLGVVNDLPPAEASLLQDSFQGATDQLKRLNVIKPNVDSIGASSVRLEAQGLRFDDSAIERVNDHLAITKLVAGTITIGQQVSSNSYTDSFLHTAFPNGVPQGKTYTLDITKQVQESGRPVRIATVDVDGQWYPSLFYSIADAGLQAAHVAWPAESVPAVGASSADGAVRAFVQAAMNEDAKGIIERTSPDEMAALHDVGQVLVRAAGPGQQSGLRIDSMNFADRDVTGGVDTVLRSMTLTDGDDRITINQSGTCYTVRGSGAGENARFCASDITKELGTEAALLPPQVVKVIEDMVSGLMRNGVGIVATQVDGQWYVAPGRTFTQLALDIYGSVTQQDFAALLQFSQQLRNPH
ncbi:MAG TPA: flagellar basal body protein FliL [Pseudonocardiaceae bacterium]|nr:flagellar basal body protein FliL [Pseudonocardiaceae bacterium]